MACRSLQPTDNVHFLKPEKWLIRLVLGDYPTDWVYYQVRSCCEKLIEESVNGFSLRFPLFVLFWKHSKRLSVKLEFR